jgi:hypothetical protein
MVCDLYHFPFSVSLVEDVLGLVTCTVNQVLVFPTVKPPDLMNLRTTNSIRINPGEKNRSLVFRNPIRLKSSFIFERSSPGREGRRSSHENEVIALLPDLPCRDNEHFHEERIRKSLFGLYHHL